MIYEGRGRLPGPILGVARVGRNLLNACEYAGGSAAVQEGRGVYDLLAVGIELRRARYLPTCNSGLLSTELISPFSYILLITGK